MLLTFITWLLFGALIGWIAYLIGEQRSAQRSLIFIAIGMIGSIAGGLLVTSLLGPSTNELHLTNFILALPAVIALLGLFEYTSSR